MFKHNSIHFTCDHFASSTFLFSLRRLNLHVLPQSQVKTRLWWCHANNYEYPPTYLTADDSRADCIKMPCINKMSHRCRREDGKILVSRMANGHTWVVPNFARPYHRMHHIDASVQACELMLIGLKHVCLSDIETTASDRVRFSITYFTTEPNVIRAGCLACVHRGTDKQSGVRMRESVQPFKKIRTLAVAGYIFLMLHHQRIAFAFPFDRSFCFARTGF